MEYHRRDSFPLAFEPNEIPFDSYSRGKLFIYKIDMSKCKDELKLTSLVSYFYVLFSATGTHREIFSKSY